jgi:hypothetical protein
MNIFNFAYLIIFIQLIDSCLKESKINQIAFNLRIFIVFHYSY